MFHPMSWRMIVGFVAAAAAAWGAPPAVGAEATATFRDVAYGTVEPRQQTLDVYLTSAAGPRPTVVFIHGGGFVAGDKSPCPSYILEPYLASGFHVVSVNYRLAPAHRFPAALEDVAAAVALVRRRAGAWRVDAERLVLTGESAGGLISALAGARLTGAERVAAVIPMCGEVDLELRIAEDPCCRDGQIGAPPSGGCISGGLGAFLGFSELRTDEERAVVRAASTVAQIHPDMPPYLLAHGTRDFGVPLEQSVSLYAAMTRAKLDCTLLPVVGGGHGNWTPAQWSDVNRQIQAWLAERLKISPAP